MKILSTLILASAYNGDGSISFQLYFIGRKLQLSLSHQTFNELLRVLVDSKRTEQALPIFSTLLRHDSLIIVKNLDSNIINKLLLSACYIGKTMEVIKLMNILLQNPSTAEVVESLVIDTLLVNLSKDVLSIS